MPEKGREPSVDETVMAWRDPLFRALLDPRRRDALPPSPAGRVVDPTGLQDD